MKVFGMTPNAGSKFGAACGVRACLFEISRGSDRDLASDVILDFSLFIVSTHAHFLNRSVRCSEVTSESWITATARGLKSR